MPPGGYTWWYLDGTSDDGRQAITIIAFIGSVFSPYYWAAGRRRPADHIAMNIAVYGTCGNRWAMTERRASELEQTRSTLRIGPSQMIWRDGHLELHVDEIGCPRPFRIRGRIRLSAGVLNGSRFAIDAAGRHVWQPLSTSARIEVDLEHPHTRWTGCGYLDTNAGDEPLEAAFRSWSWSRATTSRGTVVQYDVLDASSAARSLTVLAAADGTTVAVDLPRPHTLDRTRIWRMARGVRSDADGTASVARTLEDTPFYARSLMMADVLGERVSLVHESLDLRRFSSPLVKFMLAFRMPRRWV